MVERQAIKLKLDQLIIQQGGQIQDSKTLNKDEYTKVIL
jgi:hypothetical protein